MILNRKLMQRAFVVSILMFLIGLGMVAAADNDMMDCCRQPAAGNETSGYWQGMMGAPGIRMMESVEVSAMGNDMHDEMQGLVTRMMGGSLSSTDQARMVEIMNTYPGASNMMMTRMLGGDGSGAAGYPGMMGGYGYGSGGSPCMMGNNGQCYGMMGGAGMMDAGLMTGGSILIVLLIIIWMIVGILLILWLVKQLRNDKGQS